MLQAQSLMQIRSKLLMMTRSDKHEDVAAILILAFRKYQAHKLSQGYFDYSLMPQLIPLVKAAELQNVENLLKPLIQTD